MKTWLIILSVAVVLLAAGTGVGFWMLTDAMAEPTDTGADLATIRADVTSTQAELTEIQQNLEDNFGHPPEGATLYPWRQPPEGKYQWCEGIEGTVSDLEQRVEDLEWLVGQGGSISGLEQRVGDLEGTVQDLQWAVRDLEQQLLQLENTLHIHGIY